LVGHAAGYEQPAFVMSVHERADTVEVPRRLDPPRSVDIHDAAQVVRVRDPVTTAAEMCTPRHVRNFGSET